MNGGAEPLGAPLAVAPVADGASDAEGMPEPHSDALGATVPLTLTDGVALDEELSALNRAEGTVRRCRRR